MPDRPDDLAVDGGVLALGRDDGVDVGRRAADVDDEHVLAARLGQHLDPAQHRVGGGGAHELGEPAAAREALAADDVPQEDLADGGARAVGGDLADARQDVAGDGEAPSRRLELGADGVRGVGVAGDHDRGGDPGPGQAAGVVQEDVGVAPVGAADEEDEVGPVGAQGGDVGAGHRPGRDVDDAPAAERPTRKPASAVTSRS